MENNLKIDLGTINFWIKENTISFNDNKITEIFQLFPDGGSVFMIKDSDNFFKIMYVVLGKGRIDLEYNASLLDATVPHMFTITWNIKDAIKLYIDGKEVFTKNILFDKN